MSTTERPDGPTDLQPVAWKGIAKRAFSEFRADNGTDWAASLTYYGVQAMFPALLVLLSIVGLAGRSATDSIISDLNDAAPGPARDIVTSGVENLQGTGGTSLVLLLAGVAGALWSASGYVGAFTRASNAIWEVEEGRPFYKLRPWQLLITFVLLVLLSVSSLAVLVTGGIAEHVGDWVGVGSSAVSVWDIAKWPVLLLLVSFMLSILYWAAPNVRQPGFRWVTPGGLVAVLIWVLASALFALYVANFASYNKTYGSLGAVIAFLVWLWITNIAVLFGAEVNAETTRARQMALGQPEWREPIVPPREVKDEKDDTPEGAQRDPAPRDAAPTPRPVNVHPRSVSRADDERSAPAPAPAPMVAQTAPPAPVAPPRAHARRWPGPRAAIAAGLAAVAWKARRGARA